MKLEDIKIEPFLSHDTNKTTFAYVNLSFPVEIDGEQCNIKIDSYRVMVDTYGNSQNGFRLVPPSIKKGFQFKPVVFMDGNKEIWFKLEKKILEQCDDLSKSQLDAS